MNILLVGNGFDLHHKFPTSYINFMHTFQFLLKHYEESFDSIDKVLGNTNLQANDTSIKDCYEKHSRIYKVTPLPVDETEQVIEKAKSNLWYTYFSSCVTKSIRWIDFEKEISRVIEAFSTFFNSCELILFGTDITFNLSDLDAEDSYILKQFSFFFEKYSESIAGGTRLHRFKDQYVHEKIAGSKSYHINSDDIIDELYNSLKEFAKLLQWYLLYFVDAPAKEYAKYGCKPH